MYTSSPRPPSVEPEGALQQRRLAEVDQRAHAQRRDALAARVHERLLRHDPRERGLLAREEGPQIRALDLQLARRDQVEGDVIVDVLREKEVRKGERAKEGQKEDEKRERKRRSERDRKKGLFFSVRS